MNKLIVPWEKSVVPGCLFLLVMVMAVGAYVGIKEEERAFNPVYQEQKTAGPMVNRAVGAAMEKYLDPKCQRRARCACRLSRARRRRPNGPRARNQQRP